MMVTGFYAVVATLAAGLGALEQGARGGTHPSRTGNGNRGTLPGGGRSRRRERRKRKAGSHNRLRSR